MERILSVFYFILLVALSLFGVYRFWILYLYYHHSKEVAGPKAYFEKLPKVTVQLPLYNEMYVARRLLESVTRLDYPKELLEVQVLDDSDDETTEIVQEIVEKKKAEGFMIEHLHRNERKGFKAGALRDGFKAAKGELIAIFDADFVPPSNFLQKTVHYFSDGRVGMVQVRWGHLNREYSLLTRVQSVLLDGLFVIQHSAKERAGMLFNFNGTCGTWRRQCIEDAGGWQDDTLAEDMDLSYRSQLRGWKFVYLPNVVSPGELPVEMNAFKSQQFRWAKGAIQTARKIFPQLWKSNFPFLVKLESSFYLLNNTAYLLTLVLFMLLLPAIILGFNFGRFQLIWFDIPIFLLVTVSFWVFYICSQMELYKSWPRALRDLVFLSCVGIGLALNNTRAVLEGLWARKSSFVRTPKYDIRERAPKLTPRRYFARRDLFCWAELFLALYFAFLTVLAFQKHLYFVIPFLMLFQAGFLYVGISSFRQGRAPLKPSLIESRAY